MSAQSARSAEAVSLGRAPLGWLILLPLACLVLGQALLAWTGAMPVLEGTLADPDSYMRLTRVLQLHETGNWFDSRFYRINPPDGHVQHWTRALDLLLLAGAWLLEPVLGFARGLHVWGVLFSPVCLALTIAALGWAGAPLLDRDARLLACFALLLQPTVIAYASVGRPDHHALLLLLFVILLGLTVRLMIEPEDRRSARLAGLTAAFALWTSPEALTFVGTSLAALGLGWLLGERRLAHTSRSYLVCLTLSLATALLIERGPAGLMTVENDRLSVLHLALFGWIALFWGAVVGMEPRGWPKLPGWRRTGSAAVRRAAERPNQAIARRVSAAACGLVMVALGMLLLFPELRQGPLGEVDPVYRQLRLERIVEIQPLIAPDWLADGKFGYAAQRVILLVGIALFALPFLIARVIGQTGPQHRAWLALLPTTMLFLGLAFYQVRWSIYTQAALVLPYAGAVVWLLARVVARLPAPTVALSRVLAAILALFWPLLLGQALPAPKIVTADQACPVAELAALLNRSAEPRTILALADYGPELLYRTPHRVLSIPNHRPQPGFGATYRALTAADPEVARRELAHYGVDWLLLCPSAVERAVFSDEPSGAGTFYSRVLADGPPAWLRRLPLEGTLAESARLYEIVPAPALAGRPELDLF